MERNYISLNNKMLEFLAEKEPGEQSSIKETDRDSVESSEQARTLSQQDIQTIESLHELSKANQEIVFNKQGESTVKDENSIQQDMHF